MYQIFQWFGNLLTCEFWGDLWLNEGFASFMEYTATDAAELDWKYVRI
jgi:aminopeptidase N